MDRCQLSATSTTQCDVEGPPGNYTETTDDNPVTQLMQQYKGDDVDLEYDRGTGFLRSPGVQESTQALVFSKASLQVRYISPRNPRTIYFNDDVHVGWVRGSEMMELSAIDPRPGAAFDTGRMSRQNAQFKQAGYARLRCHATTMTQSIPGHAVRSVFALPGVPIDPNKGRLVQITPARSQNIGEDGTSQCSTAT